MADLAIGINYNVAETVDELMLKQLQYKRLHQMQAAKNAKQVQTSAYNSLKTLFSDFQTQLSNLDTAFNTVIYQAASSNASVVNGVSVKSNAVGAGVHTVNVTQLASAQQYLSGSQFASSNQQLGITETMTFTNSVNAQKNFSIEITATDTLEGIRDKINNSHGDVGISAAIVASTSGGLPVYNLVLTTSSGTANAVNITGDTAFSFSQTVAAKDTQFTFDGLSVVRSSNVITDVLEGLNFTISDLGSATINISNMDSNISGTVQTAIQNMLTAYNKIITFLDGNQIVGVYDDKNKIKSSGRNDAFSFIKSRLQEAVNKNLGGTGSVQLLRDAGIKLSPDSIVKDQYDRDRESKTYGSLMIDDAKSPLKYNGDTLLQYKLKTDFNAVKDFFMNASAGLSHNMNDVIDNWINSSDPQKGIILNAITSLDKQQKTNDIQIESEKNRLAEVREGLIDKFSQLNAIISTYQNISNYLDKQNEYLSSLVKGRK